MQYYPPVTLTSKASGLCDIMSMPGDSKDTVLCVPKKLHTSFILELGFGWLIVVGDAKTYDILQGL